MTHRHVRFLSWTLGLGLGLGLLSTAARPEGAETASALSAEEIVVAAVRAAGGETLDEVRTVKRRAEMHLEGEMFGTLDGTWEIAFYPGKKGFQRADFGSAATSTGWDGAAGWEETEMGLRSLAAEEIALNRWLWELSPLHALARDSRVGSIQRVADEEINGALHYVLEYTDELGTRSRIYVSSRTRLISRIATSIYIPMLGRCAVTNDYSDYREVEGVVLPQVSSQVIEGLWVYRARFTETEINPELPESLFENPAGS